MTDQESRVLIVDDDVQLGEAIQRALVRAGFTVKRLDSGFGVAATTRQWAPDVILLDLSMPGLDGEGVHRVLQSFSYHGLSKIPVVFWSGRVQADLDATARRTDAVVVSKKTPINDLIEVLREIVGKHREALQLEVAK